MRARPALVLALIAALVVVTAIVALVLSANRVTPSFDRGTPEGAAQAYAAAILSGDDATAVALLDPALGCSSPLPWSSESRASFALVSSRTTGEGATVVLDISERQGGAFAETWSHRETLELTRRDAGWLVTGQPWPVYSCR